MSQYRAERDALEAKIEMLKNELEQASERLDELIQQEERETGVPQPAPAVQVDAGWDEELEVGSDGAPASLRLEKELKGTLSERTRRDLVSRLAARMGWERGPREFEVDAPDGTARITLDGATTRIVLTRAFKRGAASSTFLAAVATGASAVVAVVALREVLASTTLALANLLWFLPVATSVFSPFFRAIQHRRVQSDLEMARAAFAECLAAAGHPAVRVPVRAEEEAEVSDADEEEEEEEEGDADSGFQENAREEEEARELEEAAQEEAEGG